ncbi:MAG TPA: SRPBCC domain-containing protein [Puia sp.]|nr:SRPBCC domain-containing protein [Puia sp.]
MTQLPKADFSQFKLRVNIKTNVENAYRAWASPSGLASWFLGKVTFTDASGAARTDDSLAQEGDEYVCYSNRRPDTVIIKGKVLKANGRNLYSFSFSKECPVTISMYMEHDETIVELIESNLPTDEETMRRHYVGDSKGWIFYLTNLKSVLEGGLDLRNKNADIVNVITH